MKTEVKKLDKLKRTIKIEVKGEEFLNKKKEVYRQNAKNLKVPGFRPGSAPLEVLEKYHGKLLKEEFLKESVPSFYNKAIEDNNILPAGLARIYDIKCSSDLLSFSADFETKPQIEIKENSYKGLKIKDIKIEVKEVDIEKVLTNLKEGIKKIFKNGLSDEELAKWASYPDIGSLKEAIKAQLFGEKLKERRQNIDSQIREYLLKNHKIDLPKSEIERYHKDLVSREIYNLGVKGVSQEDIDKYKPDLDSKLKPLAENEVKLFYIFEAIAKKENIAIDNNLAEVISGFILSQAEYK